MGHNHSHHTQNKKAFMIAFLIITIFMIMEFIGGTMTNSLALLSDAGHMLSDSISLGVGLLAFILGRRAVSESKTFGYQRLEILAALFNGFLLIVISILIMWESFQRFTEPQAISSTGMLLISSIGAFVNIIVAWIMHQSETSENLNMRAAFLHVIGDLLGSVSAIIASLLIMYFGWTIADPITSLIVSLLILKSGIGITSDTIHMLMEGRPAKLDVEKVREKLLQIPGVVSMHDFHVWSITSNFPSISCHLVISNQNHDLILKNALRELHDTFDLEHATIQVESVHADLDQYEHYRCNHYVGQGT
ncbi:cation diffusion facilitator family transporter [Bacillaceae bacterium C204]|uniref:cation diffusion facilitator family transporter n=1 Tax=Neobacillus sp. 204 TaxID=3383351 RepID=UPI003978337B